MPQDQVLKSAAATATNAVDPSEPKREKLTGKSNYLGWAKVMKQEMKSKGLMNSDGSFTATSNSQVVSMLLKSVSYHIASMADDSSAKDLWEWLAFEYGETDSWQLKRDLKAVRMSGVDLDDFLQRFNLALTKFKAADGNMDLVDVADLILDNINQEFYLDAIRKIRLDLKSKAEVTTAELRNIKSQLKDFFNATPVSVRNQHNGRANHVDRPNRRPARLCEFCQKHQRDRVMKSHDTAYCRFGDVPGWERQAKAANASQTPDNDNKNTSSYVAFHDTGSTPTSYFRDMPLGMQNTQGSVQTANNEAAKIHGTGRVRFGDLIL